MDTYLCMNTDFTNVGSHDDCPLMALGHPAPTPLPKGARGRLSLSRSAGEGWGEGGLWFEADEVHGS